MPPVRKSASSDGPVVSAERAPPYGLLPYLHHGIDLEVKGGHAVGDCPMCSAEGKFSVDCESGLWRCWVCGGGADRGGGNALMFLRLLHEAALDATSTQYQEFFEEVASDRLLLHPTTPEMWGVCRSPIPPHPWLVPGYSTTGKVDQLYKRTRIQKPSGEWVWSLLPTPGVWPEGKVHALHMPPSDYRPERDSIYIFEGPWDGMAFWEAAQLSGSNVLAVPGCNVWRDEWTVMCRGKHVTIFFDSDHPRRQEVRSYIAGYDGVVRIAKRLNGIARSVSWLRWGREGYDPDRKSGYDVRDALSGSPGPLIDNLEGRKRVIIDIMRLVEPASQEWFMNGSIVSQRAHVAGVTRDVSLETKPCHTWEECEAVWDEKKGGPLHWRSDLSNTLGVTLAVCASTQQSGNQLFVDVVGSPGSGKTTILEGALTSRHCVHVENLTKLISGFKLPDDGAKDCSFIARSNNKTWITCEFDTILASPQYAELMGKIRRIFDGKTSATYGNSDVDRIYNALRTPWIRAGTWRMMQQDQSQLGDRFLRMIISDPTEEEKRAIMRTAIRSERRACRETSNGTAGGIVDEKTRKAYALTGGYVDWLRANVEEKVCIVEDNLTDWVEDVCMDLAELSADMRARPTMKHKWSIPTFELEGHTELPSRLSKQFTRLAMHLAVVLNKERVDSEVLKIVRKVAIDTANGHSMNIAGWICSHNKDEPGGRSHQDCGGMMERTITNWCNMKTEYMEAYLLFLRKIGVLQMRHSERFGTMWMLSDRTYGLYQRIMGDLEEK